MPFAVRSKLTLRGDRVNVDAGQAVDIVSDIFVQIGCSEDTAARVAEHLADTSLCGISKWLYDAICYTTHLQDRSRYRGD